MLFSDLSPANIAAIAVGVLVFLSLLCLFFSLRANLRCRLMADLPTSKTLGVFIGLVELKGTIESEEPLVSHLAGERCVWYRWSVEEHWSRTVTESYTDSDGNRRTRTRTESGWKTVASDCRMRPFYLKDDLGIIRVVPEGAEVHPVKIFHETCRRNDPLYYEKGPRRGVSHSTGRRRFSESALPLHHSLYLVGQARLRDDVVAPEIAHDPEAKMFFLSTESEEYHHSSNRWMFWLLAMLGLILASAMPAVFIFTLEWEPVRLIPYYFLSGLVFLLLWGIGWTWTVYNSLIGLKNRVSQGWSNVDVQLKRRHDLIPNIVEVIEGVRGHEKEVQESVADLRKQAMATEPGAEGPDPEACSGRLLALMEQYPELKANENFMQLQKQLSETEQRIALARSYFNDLAMFYNNRREVFPDRFLATLAGMKPQKYIAAENFERAPVQVQLID
jgi:hypothetical protein